MKKQHTSFSSSLRFRRWSRKAYAVFVSIQHNVTIGALQIHLIERLQTKNQINETDLLNGVHTKECADEEADEALFVDPTLLLLTTTRVQDYIAAQPFYVKTNYPKGLITVCQCAVISPLVV